MESITSKIVALVEPRLMKNKDASFKKLNANDDDDRGPDPDRDRASQASKNPGFGQLLKIVIFFCFSTSTKRIWRTVILQI